MDTEWSILNRTMELRQKTKCTKFVGALTIELLRKEIAKFGFNVSCRDVFIEGEEQTSGGYGKQRRQAKSDTNSGCGATHKPRMGVCG